MATAFILINRVRIKSIRELFLFLTAMFKGGYTGIGNINADPCFVQPGHWDTNGTPNPIR